MNEKVRFAQMNHNQVLRRVWLSEQKFSRIWGRQTPDRKQECIERLNRAGKGRTTDALFRVADATLNIDFLAYVKALFGEDPENETDGDSGQVISTSIINTSCAHKSHPRIKYKHTLTRMSPNALCRANKNGSSKPSRTPRRKKQGPTKIIFPTPFSNFSSGTLTALTRFFIPCGSKVGPLILTTSKKSREILLHRSRAVDGRGCEVVGLQTRELDSVREGRQRRTVLGS